MNDGIGGTLLATAELARWPVARLRGAPRNARLHSPAQIEGIAASMRRFGFTNPLLISGDGEIIAGHGRFAAAALLGLTEVPVLVLDHLSEAERRAYLIADNRLAELATWDKQMLADEVAALLAEDLPADLLGFSDEDLAALLDDLDGDDDAPEVPDDDIEAHMDRAGELQEEWRVAAGDLWALGPHRLLCGDATQAASYSRLLAGESVDIVVTDPPYGVDYTGKTADALTIQNDGASDLRGLLGAAFRHAADACRPGATWYVTAPAGPQFLEFATSLALLGIWRQTLVWLKNAFVLGHSDFHYRHEAIFYGWKPGAPHQAPPDRGHDTIWQFDRPSRNAEHPTMKPPALFAHALQLSSKKGARVLDPFAGSGTTLVAANAVGRVARCIELDPKYCAVILERARAQGLAPHRIEE